MTDKEFWEKCGFTYYPFKSYPEEETMYKGGIVCRQEYWLYPDGSTHKEAPPIDLNNLFKYAVPKLSDNHQELTVITFIPTIGNNWCCRIEILGQHKATAFGEDPAQVLYQAISKAFGGKE